MQSRFSFFALGVGLLISLGVTAGNFFLLAPWLGLEEPDRLSTSIECFGAAIVAVGVIYAGLNLREMSGTQSDLKSMQESQYIQSFLDQWNFDVEQCLFQMEKDGVANRTSDLLKIVWFFEKLDTAMRYLLPASPPLPGAVRCGLLGRQRFPGAEPDRGAKADPGERTATVWGGGGTIWAAPYRGQESPSSHVRRRDRIARPSDRRDRPQRVVASPAFTETSPTESSSPRRSLSGFH